MKVKKAIDSSSKAVQHLCKVDRRLAKLIRIIGDLSYIPHSEDDGFSFIVHEIVEQMLSIKVGAILYGRLLELCNGTITPEAIALLSDTDIKSIGISAPKVSYIRSFTSAVLDKQIDLKALSELSDKEVFERLTAIKGIGPWTAKMFLLFVLDRADILPLEDGTFKNTFMWLYKTSDASPTAIAKKCKKWRPYSSTGARYFYKAYDLGLTKEEFRLFK